MHGQTNSNNKNLLFLYLQSILGCPLHVDVVKVQAVNENKNGSSDTKVNFLFIEESFISEKFRNPDAEKRNTAVANFATRKGKIIDVTSEDDVAHFKFIEGRTETSE